MFLEQIIPNGSQNLGGKKFPGTVIKWIIASATI